ncbi:MAG: acylphosphatase [Blastocatellia bacterium]|nr:acylphosphatase [Blastocatellia bacterium]
MMVARRFIVRGRVQGVGFRYFAIQAAGRAGVNGTVRNLPDGTVEAIAEGTWDAIKDFRAQLERGPSFARVTSVDEFDLPLTGRYSGFNVEY